MTLQKRRYVLNVSNGRPHFWLLDIKRINFSAGEAHTRMLRYWMREKLWKRRSTQCWARLSDTLKHRTGSPEKEVWVPSLSSANKILHHCLSLTLTIDSNIYGARCSKEGYRRCQQLYSPWVAENKTSDIKIPVNSYIFFSGYNHKISHMIKTWEGRQTRLTSSSNFWTLIEIYNMRLPIISCIGIIQDFRRPMDGKNNESTIGDHRSLRE